MAIIKTNPLVSGLRGMLGGTVVFKTLRGKTIMANRPRKPSKESEAQRSNRDKFAEATCFAKAMMKDPVKKTYYWRKAKKLKLPNAYTAAITMCMRGEVTDAGLGVTRLRQGFGGQGSQESVVRRDQRQGHVRRTGRGAVEGAKVEVRKRQEKRVRHAGENAFNGSLRPLRFALKALRACIPKLIGA